MYISCIAYIGRMSLNDEKGKPKTVRLNMMVDQEWIEAIDRWRGQLPGVSPNRSDTIRALVMWALEHYQGKKLPKKREPNSK